MGDDLYANLKYKVLKELKISIAEYFYLDMVHQLSHNRWCTKSVEQAADDMGITRRGLQKMRLRLLERGLIKRNHDGYLKTTDKYFAVVVDNSKVGANKVPRGANKVPRGANKVPPWGEQSSHKNYNRNTENRGLSSQEQIARLYERKPLPILPAFVIDERERHRHMAAT